GEDDSDVDTDVDGSDDGDDEEPSQLREPATTPSTETSVVSVPKPPVQPQPQRRPARENGRQFPIPDLKRGQDILVQITKEPVGKKGVRVTSEISLPGRFLVLLPFDGKIGVSKKVQNFKEKRRLRRIVRSILPEGFGVII